MDPTLLDILRCPFCGSRLRLLEGRQIADGILGCQCCAYPVVSGIPYLRTGKVAEAVMGLLGEGKREQALTTLLDLDEPRREPFRRLLQDGPGLTFRRALEVLVPGDEGAYLLYRFSDPTFLCGEAVLRALAQDRRPFAGRVLDVCGGAGHLTRSLGRLAEGDVFLADVSFAKLWLARRFVAPSCQAVCCDANRPLPFAPRAFALVACSDAFHYVWSRRLLAGEMVRLLDETGTVVLAHLHNLLCENYSAGTPLAPADYRGLFDGTDVRLFGEGRVFAALLNNGPLDLSAEPSAEELAREPALVLIATRRSSLFRVYEPEGAREVGGRRLALNPLYALERDGEGECLRLRFPSAGYELEYAACKRYLPDRVPLRSGQLDRLRAGDLGGEAESLAQRRVMLELPEGYV
jgi:uncharacterized protein YbaR (Trm112 family)/SAM-dependent methyltransferase